MAEKEPETLDEESVSSILRRSAAQYKKIDDFVAVVVMGHCAGRVKAMEDALERIANIEKYTEYDDAHTHADEMQQIAREALGLEKT